MNAISKDKLAELLAAARAKRNVQVCEDTIQTTELSAPVSLHTSGELTYNSEQQEFINLASSLKSAILIGAAGTGKTTCMKGTISSLIQSGKIPKLSDSHKYLPLGTPGIVACAYTRRAVMNLRKAMPADMTNNCLTIHKLLEYEPEYIDIENPETGDMKRTMRFQATRNQYRPLESNIRTVIIDEASMVSVELFNELKAALHPATQFIFLGDIQQLPPVFGSAILGFKMLELPTIELIQVYRQALESPIIRLAHRILSGKPIPVSEFPEWKVPGELTLHPWKKKISDESALATLAKFFISALESETYDPDQDIILIPFNKACGTDELNKHIANRIARSKNLETHEIIAGFNRFYFSVGDKVLYDKEDGVIIEIKKNPSYFGKAPQTASIHLDYWGTNQSLSSEIASEQENSDGEADDVDFMLQMAAANEDDEERVKKASHIIKIKMLNSEREVEVSAAGEINSLILGYAITIHKSQGSEWRRVFFCLHQSHATMTFRELLYTGVTRARKELYVICEPESFTKGIQSQRIKGNTLAEKAMYFQGKVDLKKQIS